MSAAAKAVIVTGLLCTVTGVGYAVSKYRRNGREPTEDDSSGTASEPVVPRVSESPKRPGSKRPGAKTLINRSRRINYEVQESPAELLVQAREFDPTITLDELTGARLAASEYGHGNDTEIRCVVDSEVNRAERRGLSLYASLTQGFGFGKQGSKRKASTRLDPRMRHLWAARDVLSGTSRGISRGSTIFYNPQSLDNMNRKYLQWVANGKQGEPPHIVSCDALTLLEAWSFDLGRLNKGTRCPPDRSKRGRNTLAWVGPIKGVNALRLFLMKPLTIGPEHTRQFNAAHDMLTRKLKK